MLFVSSIILAIPLKYFTHPEIPISDVLKIVFPDHMWLIGIIHVSILSAMIGTVHSMIWSSSALLIAYLKKFKSHIVQNLLQKNIINDRIAVLFVGFCIFITFSTLKSVDLFFSLTALFIVFAYISSMITLLTMKSEWESKQNVYTVLGLLTASVILIFAAQGLVASL